MKSAIFTRAHALTRSTLEAFPGASYAVTFAAALRIAYEEQRSSARAQWDAKTPEEQYNALLAMAWYEYGQRDARIDCRSGEMPVRCGSSRRWRCAPPGGRLQTETAVCGFPERSAGIICCYAMVWAPAPARRRKRKWPAMCCGDC